MVRRISFFERAATDVLDKPVPSRAEGRKPTITLPRLKFMDKPMPPDVEPPRKPKPPVRRKAPGRSR
jgi:hypothetical protein